MKTNSIEGPNRAPFFRAAGSITSAFERGRVLQAVAKRTDLVRRDDPRAAARRAQGITSNFERAQVLLAVASTQPLSRAGRDAYIDAAEKLGDFEQGRVLSALVKNERRTAGAADVHRDAHRSRGLRHPGAYSGTRGSPRACELYTDAM